jgi:hypothetical protein
MKEDKIAIIKLLFEQGYREKIIKMITGYNQSYINKIKNNKLHQKTEIDMSNNLLDIMTEEQKIRYRAVNKILFLKEITSNDLEDDIKYIQLLKFFLVEKEDIYNLYIH